MNKEEILIAIKDIQCRYSLPALKRNFTDKDYACLQYEKLAIHLANQQEKKDRETERLKEMKLHTEKYASEMEDKYILEKNKNNKAIEYINTMPLTKGTEWYRIQLLDILKGDDKECI